MRIINPLNGKEQHIAQVLMGMASQENHDGEPWDQMQAAAEYIIRLEEINAMLEHNVMLWKMSEAHLRQTEELENAPNPAVAAIEFALATDDGLEFLRLWFQGHFPEIREEWPECPKECFIGAEVGYGKK
jgi:hypothetical protein